MAKELILAVTKHRKFGVIFSGFIITKLQGSSFYSSIERANISNVKEIDDICDEKYAIVKQLSEYDDSYISSLFTKKANDAKEFVKNVDYEFIEKRIRPHIERRIINIVRLLKKTNTKIYYKDRKYSKIYEADRIEFADKTAEAIFHFNRNADGIQYFLSIKHKEQNIKLRNRKALILAESPGIVVVDNVLYYFRDIDSKKLLPFFDKDHISIPKQTEKVYFEKFVTNTIRNYTVVASGFQVNEDHSKPKAFLYLQNDMQGNPVLLMKYQYGSKTILANNIENSFVSLDVENDDYVFTKSVRHDIYEKLVNDQLKEIDLLSKDAIHYYPVLDTTIKEADLLYEIINWINTNSEKLTELGIDLKQLYFDRKYHLEHISVDISIDDSNDWFDIRGTVQVGAFKIPFMRLRKNIIRNIREFELPDGTIAILPAEWFVRFKELFQFADAEADGLKLNKIHFNLLNTKYVGLKSEYANRINELFTNKNNENGNLPKGIKADLRPYQVTGYNWMNQLQQNNFGGCLADDMGLGKTLQTLALLLEISGQQIDDPILHDAQPKEQLDLFAKVEKPKNGKKIKPTSLIVMPASLIHNWYNEIAKFTPQLKAFRHTGNNRSKNLSDFKNYDIVLTTYGVIRNEYETLKYFPFQYLILDESQVIKNPDSKIYKSVVQLQAKHRLVLTGTPIENSLTDLWSQMNFLNKGLLGNYNFFKKEFVSPIEKQNDEIMSEKLQTLIHPFILRRTKEQVAKDLPALTEQIQICEMSESQRKIYEEEKSAVRNNILENMEKQGVEKSSMIVLAALTRLRQLANHPKLVDLEGESGKFEEVIRVLENIISENHKVLIFSSFVQHLEIYKKYLEENNLKYSILTGQTKNRQEVIDNFQNDQENQVFLISLKAGGVGLNLTAADYVFLLDPWWNPAAENQAISRAHRMGQDKKVFVYRFISQDSIEEKIVHLQERKSELADLFINSNNPFKALSPDKIKELFD
ncbi:MAG: DEAD/DEAH box helicase [Salinivirgaceae bacterium]|nr:DEAD/DEAH box helicase [Salinivirgaceae bacterium]